MVQLVEPRTLIRSSVSPVLKIALIALSAAAIGVPILNGLGIVVFLLLTLFIVSGHVTKPTKRTWVLTLLVGSLLVCSATISEIEIEEGHNYLLFVKEDSTSLQEALPPAVYQFAKKQFAETYPRTDTTCDVHAPQYRRCWRRYGDLARPYEFSAGGFWQKPRWSRIVKGFDFDNVVNLRGGFLNNRYSNWYEWESQGDPTRRHAPYFVKYQLPVEADGSSICVSGFFAVKAAGENYRLHGNDELRCMRLESAMLPLEIIGLQFNEEKVFQARFIPDSWQNFRSILKLHLGLFSAGILVFAWIRPRWDVALPIAGFGFLAQLVCGSSLFHRHYALLHAGGYDHLTHWQYGRTILESMKLGDWYHAFQGRESVFYYMPGYRYFHALEMMIFGESSMASWAAILVVPGLVFLLFRTCIPALPSMMGALLLILVMPQYAGKVANLAESVAYPFAIVGVIVGVSALRKKAEGVFAALFLSGVLLAASVLLRPNLLPACVFFLFLLWILHVRLEWIRPTLAIGLGFSVSLLLLLHNVYFGGKWVLLTAAAEIPQNLLVPPSLWGKALLELLTGQFQGLNLHRLSEHLTKYIIGEGGIFIALLGAMLFLTTPILVLRGTFRQTLKRLVTCVDRPMFAVVLFWMGLHLVLLFFHPRGRYALLAGIMSGVLIGVIGWRLWFGEKQWPVLTAFDDFFDKSLKAGPDGILSTFARVWPLGLFPVAPATLASGAGAMVGFSLNVLYGWQATLAMSAVLGIAGIWITNRYCRESGESDPREIVIDEVAGQLIASAAAGTNPWLHIVAFMLFRFFDILKPGPIRSVEALPDGVGVMADDLVAGMVSAGITYGIGLVLSA